MIWHFFTNPTWLTREKSQTKGAANFALQSVRTKPMANEKCLKTPGDYRYYVKMLMVSLYVHKMASFRAIVRLHFLRSLKSLGQSKPNFISRIYRNQCVYN